MRKELLVSSILMAAPAASLSASDIKTTQAQTLTDRQELIDLVFRSAKTHKGNFWIVNDSGEWVQQEREFKYQLKFIKIQNGYETYGENELDMEYEVVVESYFVDDGTTQTDDYFYFAKRDGSGKFTLYDCDSTAVCKEDYDNSVFWAFDAPEGKGLKFRDGNEIFAYGGRKQVFHQVK